MAGLDRFDQASHRFDQTADFCRLSETAWLRAAAGLISLIKKR